MKGARNDDTKNNNNNNNNIAFHHTLTIWFGRPKIENVLTIKRELL